MANGQLERMIDDAAWITYPLHVLVGLIKTFVYTMLFIGLLIFMFFFWMFTAHEDRAELTKDFITQESVYRVDPLNGSIAVYRDGDQGIDPHTAHNASVDPKEVFGLPHRFIKNPSWFNGTPQSWLAEKSDTFDTAFVRGWYSLEALRKKIYVAKGDATGWPAAGGRTSDAAAVRGDAGPDRAVTDTHGIDRRWPAQAAESVYKGLGKEKCCKSGGISGNFGGATSDLGALGGGPYENCFTLSANSGMGV
jgi:hypothetical protein